jgi:hypothetical protein
MFIKYGSSFDWDKKFDPFVFEINIDLFFPKKLQKETGFKNLKT